jgi:RNA polymerase sigma-70 factor, ECF subfamily
MSDQASSLCLAHVTIPSTTVDYTTVDAGELLRACANGDASAWQEFMQRFHRIIAITAYRVARRWGAGPEVVDDLVQETYLKLCADQARVLRQAGLSDPDTVFGFLKVVTANVATDHFKRANAGIRGGSVPHESLDSPERPGGAEGPSVMPDAGRALLLEKVDTCLCALTPPETRERDRTIFWLYYRQGFTAAEIADLPSTGLSLKGVESLLHRLTQQVRARLVDIRQKKPDAGEKGFGAGIRS